DLAHYNHAVTWSDGNKVEPTPPVDQTLNVIPDFQHKENEIKTVYKEPVAEKIALTVAAQLQGYEHAAIITSYDAKVLQAFKQQNSQLKRGLLIETDLKYQAIDQALELDCCHIGWMNELASKDLIQATQAAELNISVWTVN